ncbi:hypothetical protein G6F35_013505 [Rhizopus arrhizus]|nr:hypothetical protein G6F35_013505 [Rhizopus arrhizus]KAG1243091.1 hypothetical protein G6F68_015933 [Rhizopus microsporus]
MGARGPILLGDIVGPHLGDPRGRLAHDGGFDGPVRLRKACRTRHGRSAAGRQLRLIAGQQRRRDVLLHGRYRHAQPGCDLGVAQPVQPAQQQGFAHLGRHAVQDQVDLDQGLDGGRWRPGRPLQSGDGGTGR